MERDREHTVTTIDRLEDIPAFASEEEEHAFWATHELSDALWDQAEPFEPDELPRPRPATRPIAIHLDEHTAARIKALAQKRHKEYQALAREFIIERLCEEEKREGMFRT